MRIAHYGTFDVRNYGDSLFPILVRNEFPGDASEFVHVSPVGGQAYSDVPECVSVAQFHRAQTPVDAVIVGGGNILHSRRTPLVEYAGVNRTAYPNLWADAAKVAADNNAPFILNAPGVPQRPGMLTKRLMRQALESASYLSVRDRRSAEMISDMNLTVEVNVVPDTALVLSDAIAPGSTPDDRYIAVHVNERYMDNIDTLATWLDEISKALDARIKLIAIGACHGDGPLADAIASRMLTEPSVLADPQTVGEVARAISGSILYLGSSLHGFITACSYGIPGAIIADNSVQHKFLGLLDELNAPERLFSSWQAVHYECLTGAQGNWLLHPVDVGDAKARIRRHWSTISSLVGTPVVGSLWPRLTQPGRAVAVANIVEQAAIRGGHRVSSVRTRAPRKLAQYRA